MVGRVMSGKDWYFIHCRQLSNPVLSASLQCRLCGEEGEVRDIYSDDMLLFVFLSGLGSYSSTFNIDFSVRATIIYQ